MSRSVALAVRPEGGGRGPAPATTTRLVVALLAWAAAAIHLFLTPEHFAERTVYGVFFLAASVFQLAVGLLLLMRPRVALLRWGAVGSLGLLVTWVVTRAVAPPLSPEGRPEPVTALGVAASGAELATLVLLAGFLPLPSASGPWRRRAWGGVAGAGFVLLVLLASGAVSYLPQAPPRAFALQVYWGERVSAGTPLVYGSLLPHLWVVGPWTTFLLTAVDGLLVALVVTRAADPRCALPRRGLVAAAAPLVAVSGCCGAPLALFFGASAVVTLYRATPWLLAGTAAALGLNLLALPRPPTPPRGPVPHGGPVGAG